MLQYRSDLIVARNSVSGRNFLAGGWASLSSPREEDLPDSANRRTPLEFYLDVLRLELLPVHSHTHGALQSRDLSQ